MTTHPERIKDQIAPKDLPTDYAKYPVPWTTYHYGNGRFTVSDEEGRVFANVYCWDSRDADALATAIGRTEIAHAHSVEAGLRKDVFSSGARPLSPEQVKEMSAWARAVLRIEYLESREELRAMRFDVPPERLDAIDVAIRAIDRLLREDRR